jgi:hypothetical protein
MNRTIQTLKLGTLFALSLTTSVGSLVLSERDAIAQEKVSPTAKGAVGGAFLGAEVVMITESIIGVKPWWAYALGGGLGAVAGGVGGYAIEQSVDDGRIPVFMLAGGLALVIPTLVLTLNATRYMPTEGASEDRAPTNEPKADPGTPGGTSVSAPAVPAAPAAAPVSAPTPPAAAPPAGAGAGGGAPTSLFDVRSGSMRLGLPLPQVRPVFSTAERRQYGMRAETEVRLPVVQVTF